ncbi:MAG: GNAT family N-acetyltransferase [Cyclobacteriaceae bacterium]|nr:GNAT family N-acetyltransferase [Cyclobacteriaceae bacterium]
MISVVRTNSENPDFVSLVAQLDADLAVRDGSDHSFYAQFNTINKIKHVVLAYDGGKTVGCGAIKQFSPEAMEVKRMYVLPEVRNKGVASRVLTELETWAAELGYHSCVLETGKRQHEAIALYTKSGYAIIPNSGQYAGVENSVCFEKRVK